MKGLFEGIGEFFGQFLDGFGVIGDAMLLFVDNFLWLTLGLIAVMFFHGWMKRRKQQNGPS